MNFWIAKLERNNMELTIINEQEVLGKHFTVYGTADEPLFLAKDYGMSAKKLNKILHELKIQFKQGSTWLLYQKYAGKGYTQSKTHTIDADYSKMHTYWTQKGRLFLYDLLKNKKGILPLIEQKDVA